jgi:hypothetical protein
MAIATAVSIGTSNKVTMDYQSQEVSISVTFELERDDADLQAFVTDKAAEVERAHSVVWRRIRELRAEQKAGQSSANGATTAEPKPVPRADTVATHAADPPQQPEPSAQARDGETDPFEDPKPRRGRNGKKPGNGAAQLGSLDEAPNASLAGGNGAAYVAPTNGAVSVPAASPAASVGGNGHGAAAVALASTAQTAPAAVGSGNGSHPQASGNGSGQGDVVPFGPNDTSASLAQQRAILSLANRAGLNDRTFTALLQEHAGKTAVEQLTRHDAARLLVEMQRRDRVAAYPAA